MRPLAGHLLVAPPQEHNLDFIRTVILVTPYVRHQVAGVVLDRPLAMTVKEAWRGQGQCQCEGHVYAGGPVFGPLMALHTDESLGEIEVVPGVYYSVQMEHLEQMLCHPAHPVKVFRSHVG
jgi:putative transcriptional regulator